MPGHCVKLHRDIFHFHFLGCVVYLAVSIHETNIISNVLSLGIFHTSSFIFSLMVCVLLLVPNINITWSFVVVVVVNEITYLDDECLYKCLSYMASAFLELNKYVTTRWD